MKKILTVSTLLIFLAISAFSAEESQPATTQTQASQETQKAQQQQEEKVKLSFDGKIEVSASYNKSESSDSKSEMNALANIGFNLSYRDWINGRIEIEIEKAKTYPDAIGILNQTYITLGNSEKLPLIFKAGKFLLPYQTANLSILYTFPLTKNFGEINQLAMEFILKLSSIQFGIGIFKTNAELNMEYVSKHLHDGYFYIRFEPSFLQGMLVNLALITNILDSEFMTNKYSNYISLSNPKLTNRIQGLGVAIKIPFWKMNFSGEFITAFRQVVFLNNNTPYSFYLELSIKPFDNFETGVRFEKSNEIEYKTKIGAIFRVIFGDFNIAFEYIYGKTIDDKNSHSFTLVSTLNF